MLPFLHYVEIYPKKWIFTVMLLLLGTIQENQSQTTYVPPGAKVEPLQPVGLRMSIPHEEGISLVAYHVKFNDDFYSLEAGTIAVDIIKPKNGRWVYEDRSTKLKVGDTIYYWLHVVYNGLGYNLLDQNYVVKGFFNYDGTPVSTDGSVPGTSPDSPGGQSCATPSPTQIYQQDGRRVSTCPGQLLFEDNFDAISPSRWTPVERFSDAPDYEFVVYMNKEENLHAKDGILHIKPTLLEDKYGGGFSQSGNLSLAMCTGAAGSTECTREATAWNILPPIISARLNTKRLFTFLYGHIEIRAKLPRGDWIYPLITLECLDDASKNTLAFYEMRVACAAGNSELTSRKGIDLSGHVLTAGALGITIRNGHHGSRSFLPKKTSSSLWSDDYHVYELEWNRERIVAKVDGMQYGEQILSAAFDKPYYLSLGVAVGGLTEFEDMSRSGSYRKPWRNVASKAALNFYDAHDKWYPTWINSDTGLHVDYVKVRAL